MVVFVDARAPTSHLNSMAFVILVACGAMGSVFSR